MRRARIFQQWQTFRNRCQHYRYEIITLVIMLIMGWLNVIGINHSSTLPAVAPGYYENNMLEHSERLLQYRNEYLQQKQVLNKETIGHTHTEGEIAAQVLYLNTLELRYIAYWRALTPFVIGMLKPLDGKDAYYWYDNLSPDVRKSIHSVAKTLDATLPAVVECEATLAKENKIISTGLRSSSDEEVLAAKIATLKGIAQYLGDSERSAAFKCDKSMVDYMSNLQRLANSYTSLEEAYQSYQAAWEIGLKIVNGVLLFLLALFSAKCRSNLIQSATKPFGG